MATVSRAGERLDVGVVEVGAVVDRGGARARPRAARPARGRAGCRGRRSPSPAARPGLEHRPRLVGVEGAALAEDVDPAAVRRAGGEHLAADEVDVGVGPALELGRDDVGAEEGDVVGELGGDLAGAALGRDVEAVAGLDLDVGDPGAQRLGPPRGRRARRAPSSLAARVASVVTRIPPAS